MVVYTASSTHTDLWSSQIREIFSIEAVVGCFMSTACCTMGESLPTSATFERFFASVEPLVASEGLLKWE